jgi:ABC-type sugar transport system permease subunit
MTKFKLSYRFKQKVTPYIFILPFYLLFITFMAYPVVFSLIASFSKWNGVREMEWVGLRNYVNLIQDKVFLQSLINGLVMFLMYVPAMILFALILAILLNKPNIRFKNFFRTAIFVPYITSGVAIAYIFMLIFDSKFGLANKALTSIGLPAIPWLSSILGARFVLGLLVTWKYMGYNMILMKQLK